MKKISFLFFISLITIAAAAQDSTFQQMLDLSRPGKNHAILGNLSGTWAFQDAKLSFVKGTLVRNAIYNGRFYTVQITGGKLQVPVADGKMKEENYQGMQIEGYDNVRMKFVTTSLNNHIGSDIELQMGTYDSITMTFTYEWTIELVEGKKKQNQRVIEIIDNDHYSEKYYENQNGVQVKVGELDYTRAK